MVLEEFEQSVEHFENALETFNELVRDSTNKMTGSEIPTIYNNLGIVSKSLNQPEKAIDYYLRGINLAQHAHGQEQSLANLHNNLGGLYLDQGKTKIAFENLVEALNLRLKIDDKTG